MSGRILLFAGPSLVPQRCPLPAPFLWRPPARCGDLLRAAGERPAAVLLVDGVFETAPTVWHKEILLLLEAGIPVYGAASLGALRAAELDVYGMVGIGAIYRAYRDGVVESDDAVMVLHAPAELGYAPLTLALVDAEASIKASQLPPQTQRCAIGIARSLPFRARTWEMVFARLADEIGAVSAQAAAKHLRSRAFSQKARDVDTLIALVARGVKAPKSGPSVPRTVYLKRLIDTSA